MGRRAKPPKGKAEAKRPLARKSPKNEDSARVRDLEQRLAEALKREAESLDQQKATSEILRVISSSPTNVQPVFDAIVASAVRLLRAYTGVLTRIEGDQLVLAALTSTDDTGDAALRAFFQALSDRRRGRTPRPFAIARRSTSPTPRPIPDCPKPCAPTPVSGAIEARSWCRCFGTTSRLGRSR